jgi:hypothetical protein
VHLQLAWGQSAEAADFRLSKRQFIVDWRCESKDIEASLKS